LGTYIRSFGLKSFYLNIGTCQSDTHDDDGPSADEATVEARERLGAR
jgi:hypothetical protein